MKAVMFSGKSGASRDISSKEKMLFHLALPTKMENVQNSENLCELWKQHIAHSSRGASFK